MLKSVGLITLVLGCSLFPVCFAVDSPKAVAPDYSKEAFVLEQSSDKFRFENDGTYTREIHMEDTSSIGCRSAELQCSEICLSEFIRPFCG